jgi:catechol 2,3-dioxygenase-like lactoylglutathione lyase family enzyme
VRFDPVLPILRFFSEAEAKRFYVDYLGMQVDWEHRFEPGMPLYLQVSRDALVLHLSEHHGDGTPGTHVLINMTGIEELHAELCERTGTGGNNPGLDTDELGTWITVHDPFGNVLKFRQPSDA